MCIVYNFIYRWWFDDDNNIGDQDVNNDDDNIDIIIINDNVYGNDQDNKNDDDDDTNYKPGRDNRSLDYGIVFLRKWANPCPLTIPKATQ